MMVVVTEKQIGETAEEMFLFDDVTLGELVDYPSGRAAFVSEILELVLGSDPADWARFLKQHDPGLYESARAEAEKQVAIEETPHRPGG